MSSSNKLFKEQINYLIEHYPTESNNVIANAMNIIGERLSEAAAQELLVKASSLNGMEQIKCMEKAFDTL